MNRRLRVLILAGTTEARALAARLSEAEGFDVVASLAGATHDPEVYAVPTRIGGFGGADGLAHWLRSERIDVVVDATHPFAAQISSNAALACEQADVPLTRLERDAWETDAAWIAVGSIADAVARLPSGARAFLATGKGTIEQLQIAPIPRDDIWAAIRVIDPPADPFPMPHGTYEVTRPPFTLDDEVSTFKRLAITHLVAKNSGGMSGRAKLDAARTLGVQVVMIQRPTQSHDYGSTEQSVDGVVRRLNQMTKGPD